MQALPARPLAFSMGLMYNKDKLRNDVLSVIHHTLEEG